MHYREVAENTFKLTENERDILFEGMWPIPNGVAINSYVVKGKKTALIDGVSGWNGSTDELFEILENLGASIHDIDYIIINHYEPDHSGWISTLKKIRKNLSIICSDKGADLLEAFFHIPRSEARIVKDGDTLDLGNGHVLTFAMIPNVHWPDTMVTYDTKTQVLFSCDAFGSYGTVGPRGRYPDFDDDNMTETLNREYFEDTKRYYANIVAAFTKPTEKAIQKAGDLIGLANIKAVCPSHGIVYRKNPGAIVNDYIKLVNYQKGFKDGNCEVEVSLIWGSMYGMTRMAVEPIISALESQDIKVNVYKIPDTHLGEILNGVWSSSAVILGMPTYEYKMYPPMFEVIDELFKKKVQNKLAFRFGSFGWSGGAQKELDELITKHKPNWEFIEPVEFRGKPKDEDIENIRGISLDIAKRIKAEQK